MFKKKEEPVIEFSCKEWAIRKYAPVAPASEFLPKEFEELHPGKVCPFDNFRQGSILSARMCPAIGGYLSAGYVIPAWGDIEITFNNGEFNVQYSNLDYRHMTHPEEQFGNMFSRFKNRTDIKLDSPWTIKTKPGYSVMWMPMWFHNTNYQAVPGIVDTDRVLNHNPINIMLYEQKDTLIKMGDPLVQVIPFKREDITAVSREYTENDFKRLASISGLLKLSRWGWRQWLKNRVSFTLDRRDTDLP